MANYPSQQYKQFITVCVSERYFAVALELVDSVGMAERFTEIPTSSPEIAGIINLRGRMVLALRTPLLLGFECRGEKGACRQMVNIKYLNDSYGLLVDNVGDVVSVNVADIAPNPINLCAPLAGFSQGVVRLDNELVTILMAEKLIAKILSQSAA